MQLTFSLSCFLVCFAGASAIADEYRVYVDDALPSRRLLARLPQLRAAHAGITWKIVRLGASAPAREQPGNTLAALQDGVRYLPTLVLADEKGVYARVIGAVATREGRTFEDRLAQAQAMKQGDRFALTERLKTEGDYARLYSLVCRATQLAQTADAAAITTLEGHLREALGKDTVAKGVRQHITLAVLYPLALRRYVLAYHGAHTPESEALFLRAIGILEEARDIDPATADGRQAHQLREELRRARLQAARQD